MLIPLLYFDVHKADGNSFDGSEGVARFSKAILPADRVLFECRVVVPVAQSDAFSFAACVFEVSLDEVVDKADVPRTRNFALEVDSWLFILLFEVKQILDELASVDR